MRFLNDIAKPTDAELEILHVLWREGPSTVRTVNEQLATRRGVGYTTTLKIMQIMYDKGMLAREQKGRGHVYRALYEETETQTLLVDRFMDTAFGGSAAKLVMRALGSKGTSREEIDEIKRYLDTFDGKDTP